MPILPSPSIVCTLSCPCPPSVDIVVISKGRNLCLRCGIWRPGRVDVRGVVTPLRGGTLAAVRRGDVISLQVMAWPSFLLDVCAAVLVCAAFTSHCRLPSDSSYRIVMCQKSEYDGS